MSAANATEKEPHSVSDANATEKKELQAASALNATENEPQAASALNATKKEPQPVAAPLGLAADIAVPQPVTAFHPSSAVPEGSCAIVAWASRAIDDLPSAISSMSSASVDCGSNSHHYGSQDSGSSSHHSDWNQVQSSRRQYVLQECCRGLFLEPNIKKGYLNSCNVKCIVLSPFNSVHHIFSNLLRSTSAGGSEHCSHPCSALCCPRRPSIIIFANL